MAEQTYYETVEEIVSDYRNGSLKENYPTLCEAIDAIVAEEIKWMEGHPRLDGEAAQDTHWENRP